MRTVAGVAVRGQPESGAASWQGSVKDKDLTAPPGSPTLGDRYIVSSPATGLWSGEENSIAEWDGDEWLFDAPAGGWVVYVDDEGEIYVFNGSSWAQESFGPHAATHQNGGADEISVAALSGLLADAQTPLAHAASHVGTGADLLAAHANVLYVGKQGNDSNDGKHPDRPFLTFGAAVTAASGETPSTSNRFVIVCHDAGIYSENVGLAAYISLYAPDATVTRISLYDQCYVTIGRIAQPSQFTGCVIAAGSGSAYLRARYVEESNGSSGLANAIVIGSGETIKLVVDIDELNCATTIADGISLSGGTVVGRVGRIKLVDGVGISLGEQVINLFVGEIEITGTGDGIVAGTNSNLNVTVGSIFDGGSGTGIRVSSGTARVSADRISCATAYNVTGGALYLFVGELSGTETVTDGEVARVTKTKRNNYAATTDPTLTDDDADGYTVGSEWFNVSTDEKFVCADAATAAAVWRHVVTAVKNEAATTDATQTTIATIPIPDDTAVWIEVDVIARRTDAAARGKWKRGALVYRESAGAATIEGAVWTPLTVPGATPYDVTIDVSGNDARIRVTGAGSTDLNWTSRHVQEERG